MKNTILILLAFCTAAMSAQIDRTTPPKVGPMPEINLGEPNFFELKNGLKVLVVENHKLPRVSYTLIIDNPPYAEGEKAGVSQLMGSLLGKGSKTIDKDAYNEEVDYMGARISFNATGASASGLSKYSKRILELMADAAVDPNFTAEELEKERNILIDNLKSNEKSVASAANRVEKALTYGVKHPYGEFVSQETVKNISLDDVLKNYRDYYVPKNAYLAVIGDVDYEDIKTSVEEYFTPWTKAGPLSFEYSKPADVLYPQINFIDMPNAVQSEISVSNIVDLKMGDPDYFPALLANKILGGSFRSYLNSSLREEKGYTYGAGSRIGADRYAAHFGASASVRNMVTDSAVVVFLDQLKRIRTEKVTAEDLDIAKAEYVGEFVMALESPETVARYALNILTENLPKDFYTTYLANINAVTPEQVQQAAQKFINLDKIRIVVTGKGKDVLENLEKVSFEGKTFPINYFDKYAKSIEKPNYDAIVPEGVSAEQILNKYLEAVGGKDKLNDIHSIALLAEAEMQGMKLNLLMKKTDKNQFMQDLQVAGNSMSLQKFNGETGFVVMQGQRKDMSAEEIAKVKEEATPFPELGYLSSENITLEGLETIEGKKAYKLKISEEKTIFYDQESGLKLQEVNTAKMGAQTIVSTITYQDYKEVSGIQFPYSLSQTVGPQSFDFKITEIKVNEGVTDADFE